MKRVLPKFRTEIYAIWRACERLSIRPPDILSDWDSCNPWAQAMLIAYSQIRDYEEQERDITMMNAGIGMKL